MSLTEPGSIATEVLAMDLATPREAALDEAYPRLLYRLLKLSNLIGRPFFTSPGVPAERVKALRGAFDAMAKDPVFLAEAQKEGFYINPLSGEELQKIVEDIVATPKPIADRLLQIP